MPSTRGRAGAIEYAEKFALDHLARQAFFDRLHEHFSDASSSISRSASPTSWASAV
jgi:hypothetical protein